MVAGGGLGGGEVVKIIVNGKPRDYKGDPFKRLIDVLRGIRHHGLLGVTTFDRKGDTTLKKVAITQARGGEFVRVPF